MEIVRLEDICTTTTSNLTLKELDKNNGAYPVYGASGLIKYIDFYNQDKEYIGIVKDGAGIGRVMLLPKNSSILGTMQYIFPNENIDIKYLYFNLIKMNLKKYYSGSTIPHIYFKDYKKEKIKLYSFEKQKKIAKILENISNIIEKKKQKLQEYELLSKCLFEVEFLNKSYYKYPLCECTTFIDYRGRTPQISSEGTIQMINAKSVGKNNFKYIDEFVTEEIYNLCMTRGLGEAGDILFVTEGHTFGNVCIIPENLKKFALGQRVITIRGKKEQILNKYLCYYMQTEEFKKDINMYKTGGTAQGIRSKDLGKILIPIPELKLQNQFAERVKLIEKSKFLLLNFLKIQDLRIFKVEL